MTRATLPRQAGVGDHDIGPGWRPDPPPPVASAPLSTGPVDPETHHLARLLVALRVAATDSPEIEAVAMALYRRQRVLMRQRGWRE